MDRSKLRKTIADAFTLEELHTLCFDLHIDYEDLRGESKQAKARELVAYCQRAGSTDALLEAIRAQRPHLDLAGISETSTETLVTPVGEQSEADSVSAPAVPRPVNLSFEAITRGFWPSGWFNSSGFVKGVSTRFIARVVARPEGGTGSCVVFWDPNAADNEFGSLMQRCPARHLAGKAVRLEGEIMTENVTGWCGLWLRADGELISDIVFDNMSRRPIRGSTSWKRYAIEVSLPHQTAWLNYGIVLAGPGTMWADDFKIMVWTAGGQWLDL